MIITRECDYAVRIVRALSDNEKKQVHTICELEFIPEQYAYKILKKLEKSSIVQGSRGRSGGYRLVKDTKELTLYDILTAVDDDLAINECMRDGYQCPRNMENAKCRVHHELHRVQAVIEQTLREKSLADIMRQKCY